MTCETVSIAWMATVPARERIASAGVVIAANAKCDCAVSQTQDGSWRDRAANNCARDARLLAGDNLGQESVEQTGTIVVTSANESVVVDPVEGSEDRARIIVDHEAIGP